MGKSKFSKFITTNPGLKLASIVLATLLWFFVVSKGRLEIVMDVPVKLKNIPASLEVVNGQKTVSIGIEGQERFLKELKKGDVKVIIDISKAEKGVLSLSLSADNVILPKSLIVTRILPQTVKLQLKEK